MSPHLSHHLEVRYRKLETEKETQDAALATSKVVTRGKLHEDGEDATTVEGNEALGRIILTDSDSVFELIFMPKGVCSHCLKP
mmetsp:Transcript_4284/g.4365  ORF Transcript_4284/g.4365 Transcript_4284/m.4365 type:complete len:83 (+) Transcript_4284:545-793(+)